MSLYVMRTLCYSVDSKKQKHNFPKRTKTPCRICRAFSIERMRGEVVGLGKSTGQTDGAGERDVPAGAEAG